MDKREIGKQRIKQIIGEKSENILKVFEEISPDFANYIIEFGYGELYTREGFSDKYRELAAVACLIGQGNTGLPLKAHLNGMLTRLGQRRNNRTFYFSDRLCWISALR